VQAANYHLVPHSLYLNIEDHPNKVQKLVNIYFILINLADCSTCLFSWYGLLLMVGGDQ